MLKPSISKVNSRFSPEQLRAVMPEISEFHSKLKSKISGVKIIYACEGGLEICDKPTAGVVLNLQGDLFETKLEKYINMKSRQSQ